MFQEKNGSLYCSMALSKFGDETEHSGGISSALVPWSFHRLVQPQKENLNQQP